MEVEQLIVLGMFLISTGLLLGCVSSFFHTRRWLASTLLTQGHVVSVRRSASRNMHARRTHYYYYPTLTFQSIDGQPITFESNAGRGKNFYPVGKRVAVRYVPTRPDNARIGEFTDTWMMTIFLGFMGAVWPLLGLLF